MLNRDFQKFTDSYIAKSTAQSSEIKPHFNT